MIRDTSYKPKQFNLKGLEGISEQTLEMHFKLYEGYVNETNKLNEKINEFLADGKVDQEEVPAYSEAELGIPGLSLSGGSGRRRDTLTPKGTDMPDPKTAAEQSPAHDPAQQTLAEADAIALEVRARYERIEQRVLQRTWTLPELASSSSTTPPTWAGWS